MNILFCTDKWPDFNPLLGFTNHAHNLFYTCAQAGHTFNTIHLDEAGVIYGKHIDEILPQYCDAHHTDVIIFSLINGTNFNPSKETYIKLQQRGIKLVILWPDTGPDFGLSWARELQNNVDLQISWDYPTPINNPYWISIYDPKNWAKNQISLWTPQDETLYYYEKNKTIDVSWLGSTERYGDRTAFVNLVKEQNLNFYLGGGQRVGKLSQYEYARIIRQSKIGINFPLSQTGVFYQAKGRIFEYTSCGALVFDIPNESTNAFYKPNTEYIPFTSFDELFNGIQYYLAHEQERLDIAMAGYEAFISKWTLRHWWSTVFERLGIV